MNFPIDSRGLVAALRYYGTASQTNPQSPGMELVKQLERKVLPRLKLKRHVDSEIEADADTAFAAWDAKGRPSGYMIVGIDPETEPHLRARAKSSPGAFQIAARLRSYGAVVKITDPHVDVWFLDETAVPPALRRRTFITECSRGPDLHVLAESVETPIKYTGERRWCGDTTDGYARDKRAKLMNDLKDAVEALQAHDDEWGFVAPE